jgi:hypothetical protein
MTRQALDPEAFPPANEPVIRKLIVPSAGDLSDSDDWSEQQP